MKQGAPIDHFDAGVSEDLEFDVIQAMLIELAGCPSSEQRAEKLVPSKDRIWVIHRLQETDEMCRIRSGGHGFPLLEFDEEESFQHNVLSNVFDCTLKKVVDDGL